MQRIDILRSLYCLKLDSVRLDVTRVKCLLRIGVFFPMRSSLIVPAWPKKGGGDVIDGIIDEGKNVPRHKVRGGTGKTNY